VTIGNSDHPGSSRTTLAPINPRWPMLWPRHLLLLALALTWCCLILSFSWVARTSPHQPVLLLAALFSQICHQDPARSFWIGGAPLPVCSRCLAIYLGGFLGIAAYPWIVSWKLFTVLLKQAIFGSAGLVLLDAGLDLTGVWASTFLSRALTGALLGIACGLALATASQNLTQPLQPAKGRLKHE
jgi:uncharacterized membrane protein